MARLIAGLDTMLDGSLLVGCTKELRRKLIEEGAVAEDRSMHFGAERGMNSAERLGGVLVIGREQPSVQALEDKARGLALTGTEPFVSVPGKRHFVRVRVERSADRWVVTPTGRTGSDLLSGLATARRLILVAAVM